MKTKLITTLLCLACCCAVACADTFSESGINYLTLSDNTVAVTTGTYSGTITVPQTVSHGGTSYTVTEIGDSAFFKCTEVTAVTIPQTITRLGKRSFSKTAITEFTITKNVTELGVYCFYGCTSLNTLNYNATNCTFTNYASFTQFENCKISVINIGNDVEVLPNGLYYYYTGDEITIPSQITKINNSAFYGCKTLKKVNYNATNCEDLTSTPFKSSMSKTIEEFNIGEGVERLPGYILNGVVSINSIKFPSTLKTIGKYALNECTGITSVEFNPSLTSIESYAFAKSGLTKVTIPEGITSIGSCAFRSCKSLTQVIFNATNCENPKGENYRWFADSPVESITFGPKVTQIPSYIAYENQNLTTFEIPSHIVSIGNYSFTLSGLMSITIPRQITSIGSHAFSSCASLTDVYYNADSCASATGTSGSMFYGSNVTNFVIGDNVRHIPGYILYRVKALESITIPENVSSIGKNPFGYDENLREVTFNAKRCVADPPITNSINAWFGDTHLYKLHIGDKVELIPEYLAYNQDSIYEYNIPESVKEIGRYAFYSCAQLKKIELPRKIEKIGNYAFYNNMEMTGDVFIPITLTSLGKYIISMCDNIGDIICEAPVAAPTDAYTFGDRIHSTKWLVVPRCSAQSYKAAEGWKRFRYRINDVTGEGDIDVSDVNRIINTILMGADDEVTKACDVDGSTAVDVSDVNMVITYMLKH